MSDEKDGISVREFVMRVMDERDARYTERDQARQRAIDAALAAVESARGHTLALAVAFAAMISAAIGIAMLFVTNHR